MFEKLKKKGFDVLIKNHGGAILKEDFPDQTREIEDALLAMEIEVERLLASGGGEAKSTQWLRRRFHTNGWPKHNFDFEMKIDGVTQVAITHEIDHVREAPNGTIALEIEWNNKDPFFDRDLENFQRLHAQSAISLGVIITRGSAMQNEMRNLVQACLKKHKVTSEAGLAVFDMKDRTKRQRDEVERRMRLGVLYQEAFAHQFVSDKFGTATTHWSKLMERIYRGVGNPCPLVLIGLPATIVKR